MKAQFLLKVIILFITASALRGEVSTKLQLIESNSPIQLRDPCVPNVYIDIMVGTRLSIIVSSDTGGYWSGGLFIVDANQNYGLLSCRDNNSIECGGSILPYAGIGASAFSWEGDFFKGYVLNSSDDANAADWFIIDYLATNIGSCSIGIFDDNYSLDVPIYEIFLNQVRTRDFNNDNVVNFPDLAFLAYYWLQTGCSGPDWCQGCDLDTNGDVDANDLLLFSEFWLKRTR